MLLRKHFSLIPGYPPDPAAPAAWRPLGPAGPRAIETLSRRQLQRIEATIVKLETEQARGLAECVADPGEWLRRARFLLGEWKAAVHGGKPTDVERWLDGGLLPGRLVTSLRRFRAGLVSSRDLFDSLLFMELTGRGIPAADLVGWCARHRDSLERLATFSGAETSAVHDATRILFILRADLSETLQSALLEVLAEPASLRVRGDHHVVRQHLRTMIDGDADETASPSTATDGPSFGGILVGLPTRLLESPPDRRRAIGTLLELMVPDGLAERIRSAAAHQQRSAAILVDRIRAIERLPPHGRAAVTKKTHSELDGLVARTEGELTLARIRRSVETLLGWAASVERIDAMRRLLTFLPTAPPALPVGLLPWWIKTIGMDRRFVENADLVSRLFARRGVHPAIAAALSSLVGEGGDDDPVSQLIWGLSAGSQEGLIALFERMVYDAGWPPAEDLVDGLAVLVEIFGDVDRAEGIARRLGPQGVEAADRSALAAIARLTGDAAEIVPLVAVAGDEETCSALLTLAEHLADPESRALAVRTGIRRDGHLLRRWAEAIRMTRAAGLARPGRDETSDREPPVPPWATRYPPPLHGVLARLAQMGPDAERIVAAATARSFPAPDALRAELTAIDAILSRPITAAARERLAIRRTRLAARLAGGGAPRPGAVAKALAILERRADEASIRAAIGQARDALRPRLAEIAGIASVAERVFDAPYADLLAGILGLPGGTRAVGLRLLLDRARGVEYDALVHPANRGFVDRLAGKGVDLGPWIDGRVQVRGTTGTGEEFVVRFSDDVLDALLMGHHFQTCLAPGQMNFFSAVTNAVDFNKQVAYGRDRKGRIVGRRLFALTDDGLLMPFAAYSHEGDHHFAAATDAFARDLAAAMGTFLTALGTVSPLVLPRWYDDGARTVPVDRSLEVPEGLLSAALGRVEPARVVDDVAAVLGGRERLGGHLRRILDLPALQLRPELVPPLAAAFGTDPEVPAVVRLRLALACHRSADGRLAARLLGSLSAAEVVAALERDLCVRCLAFHGAGEEVETLLTSLLEVRPAIVPRLIHSVARRVNADRRGWPARRREMEILRARFRTAAGRAVGR